MNALLHQLSSDTRRIDVANPHDVRAWAERLDVEVDQLCDAVELVGDDAEAVALVLKGAVTFVAH